MSLASSIAPTNRLPLPTFRLGHPERTPSLPLADPPRSLLDEYRPKLLSDILGQPCAVRHLGDYAAFPHPHAFLFAGSTGVGKSSAAHALARELGADPTTGLWTIDAGRATAESLATIVNDFRFEPMFGGWRVVIVEEADYLSACPKAAHLWLSILDKLPGRTTVVFTTNHPEKFAARFLDRVERIDFDSDPAALAADASDLITRIWREKTGRDDAPALGTLCDPAGPISFRRVVQALEPLIRSAGNNRPTRNISENPAPEPSPPAPSEPDPDGRGVPGPAVPPIPTPGRKPRRAGRSDRPDLKQTTFPEPPPVPTVGAPDADLLSMLPAAHLDRVDALLKSRYLDLGTECQRVESWQRALRREKRRRAGQ